MTFLPSMARQLNTQMKHHSQGPHTRERAMILFPGQGYLAQNDYVQLHPFIYKVQFSLQLYDIPLRRCDTFLSATHRLVGIKAVSNDCLLWMATNEQASL